MKILPIIRTPYNKNSQVQTLQPEKTSPTKQQNCSEIPIGFKFYAPIFSGKGSVINTQKRFREYAKNGSIGCVWCKRRMFTTPEKNSIMASCQSLNYNAYNTSEFLLNFSHYFTQDKINLLKEIKNISNHHRGMDFKSAIKKCLPKAESELIKEQDTIFEELFQVTKGRLPEDTRKDFNKLISQSIKRIHGIPYVSKYSAKEFYYQTLQLTKTFSNEKDAKKINTLAHFLTNPEFKEDPIIPLNKKIISNMYKHTNFKRIKKSNLKPDTPNVRKILQRAIIRHIMELAQKENRDDIISLCEINLKKIDGKPVILQFSNKAFRYKLAEILTGINDKQLIEDIEEVTSKLPTSVSNINAFIVKHKDAANSTIISNLLNTASVTIEHLVPKSRGGEDIMGNWALACSSCNGVHGHKIIKGDKFPFDRHAGQEYINRIIADANERNLFSSNDIIEMRKNYYRETGLKLNISKLKYNPDLDYE